MPISQRKDPENVHAAVDILINQHGIEAAERQIETRYKTAIEADENQRTNVLREALSYVRRQKNAAENQA